MAINPKACTVQINIWVDCNALQNGQTTGIYMVDNLGGAKNPSQNEGAPNLNSYVTQGASVCWSIYPIDPCFDGQLSINAMTQGTTGFSSPPTAYGTTNAVWTGQLFKNAQGGSITQDIEINAPFNGKPGSFTISPTITVVTS